MDSANNETVEEVVALVEKVRSRMKEIEKLPQGARSLAIWAICSDLRDDILDLLKKNSGENL
jgi:hypothetical protein